MKKICIDARLWGISHTGIGRYTENLIDHMDSDPDIETCLIISPKESGEPKLKKFEKYVAHFHPYSIYSQIEMFFLWLRIMPDLLHVTQSSIPVFWPGRMVVTFHDLIRHLSKGKETTTKNYQFYKLKYWGYLLVDKIALMRACHIFVPANYWKLYLEQNYHVNPKKISVTYEGVDPRINTEYKRLEIDIEKPFLVYTGNLYPHKNVLSLLMAMKVLGGEFRLAIVCARSVFTDKAESLVKSLGLKKQVFFLGRLTDSQMANLYSHAFAFITPSLIEGFGLPGLEAMSLRLPVISSNTSCLPEIYQDAALYFNPKSPINIAEKVLHLYSRPQLRALLIKNGMRVVSRYSWSKMAGLTWKAYKECL